MDTNVRTDFKCCNFHKIVVIGCPGSGKSVLSSELSTLLNIPVYHLDRIYWKPNWVEVTKEEFDKKLDEILVKDSWIIDGDYKRTLAKRIEKCDLIIYLDFDSQTCLDSYYRRVKDHAITGFITEGCVENIDQDFITYIKEFNAKNRDNHLTLVKSSNKPYIIFTSRVEKEDFIKYLGAKK